MINNENKNSQNKEIESKINSENEDSNNEKIKQKKWYEKMSKFEKIFWLTIAILFLIVVIFSIFGTINSSKKFVSNKPIIEETALKYIPSDIINENISKNNQKILESLNLSIKNMNLSIEKNLDDLFVEVEKNVDKYLDFHYSLKGSYIEMVANATGDLEKDIQNKIFDEDFQKKINTKIDLLNKDFNYVIKEHIKLIDGIALNDVDQSINQDTINYLRNDIETNMVTQEGKLGALLAIRFGPVITKVLIAKISAKITSKAVLKATTKLATKVSSSGTAATASSACGPFVAICAPIAAVGAWAATDIAYITGDEYLNREEFRKEILSNLKESKKVLNNEFNKIYNKEITQLSNNIIEQYKETKVLEKKRLIDRL